MKTLDKLIFTTLLTCLPVLGWAQLESIEVSGNATFATDYLYRGQSQTDNTFAIQGGFDLEHEMGLYLGSWASNIAFTDDAAEVDIYGGYSGSIGDLGYSLDVIYYWYPGTTRQNSGEDFLEWGGSLSYTLGSDFEPTVTAGIFYTDNFSFNSDEGIYIYGDVSFALPNDASLNLHIGQQSIKNEIAWGTPDWLEYNVNLTVPFMGLDFGVTYSDTDLSEAECFGGGNICDSTVVFSISRGF